MYQICFGRNLCSMFNVFAHLAIMKTSIDVLPSKNQELCQWNMQVIIKGTLI